MKNPVMERDKINKVFDFVERLKTTHSDNKEITNCALIIEKLILHIDNLQEEYAHLLEENETLQYKLQDKDFERRGSRGRRRSSTDDDLVPF